MPPRAKSRKTTKRKSAPKKVAPIPPGFRTVTPYLGVRGGSAALEFYKKAFGAKELAKETTPDGKVIHARLKIGDSIVMLSDQFDAAPGGGLAPQVSQVTLHIYTKDVDSLWSKAVGAGATILMPIDNMFWGERYGQVTDPFGHRWSLSTQIKMSKEERDAKQKAAMAQFAQDQHPDKPAGTA
jgi:PhnB protein